MQGLQSVAIVGLFVTEREASLSRAPIAGSSRPMRLGRRWFGRQLMTLGAWVSAEPAPAAGAR